MVETSIDTSNIGVHNSSDKAADEIRIPRLNERLTDELVFAFVGPVGSGCSTSASIIKKILEDDYGYEVIVHTLSNFISSSAQLVGISLDQDIPTERRIEKMQVIGDKLRQTFGNAYLAAKAIEEIAKLRDRDGFGASKDKVRVPEKLRRVHLIDSLKRPEEIELLRSTYGEIFWLIGVFAPLTIRSSRLKYQQSLSEQAINVIVHKDYKEEVEYGQNVRDVFHQADYFVRNDRENTTKLTSSLERFIGILFGKPVQTPTLDESSMYAAYAEAAKSACMSRQVGAAITSKAGELIGLGRNDVPVFGGGLYSSDHGENDHRCYAWRGRECHNDRKKADLFEQVIEQLVESKLLAKDVKKDKVMEALKSTGIKSLIEFSRAVHAEMDAIISVARTYKAGLLGGTLFSTTFPCHSCARHIVASGIAKVFFIEPYPKSLATELHSDATSENEDDIGKKVVFLQYTGIAPKNVLKLFNTGLTRKEIDGSIKIFNKKSASPIVVVSLDDYSTHEKLVVAELADNEEKATKNKQATIAGI
jgi:deoxycytidylate deaminase